MVSEIRKSMENIGNTLALLPRFWKRTILIAVDFCALSLALWMSFSLRYANWLMPRSIDELSIIMSAPIVAVPIFIRMGLYREVIRYLPERAIWSMLQAMTLAVLGWVLIVFVTEMAGRGLVPRSVPVIYWALGVIFISGIRFLAKKLMWSQISSRQEDEPVLIYGAGESGAQLAAALRRSGSKLAIGFVDDNPQLVGRDVAGLRVFSPNRIPALAENHGISEIIMSIPSATIAQRQDIIARVSDFGLRIRSMPNIADLATGKYQISQIREIDIDELLGRSTVPPDPELIGAMVNGRIIMVTGAGGSIGSELCRLIARWSPQKLVLFEANEFALYKIDRELGLTKDAPIVPVLGSIVERSAVEQAIVEHGVEVVFHAAAHKHVPMVEANALEGIRNNVFGTLTVVEAALDNKVQNFVLISSDKAVRPTNVMGATKRWAELIVQSASQAVRERQSPQLFSAVRFGNVLGSNGSVVPLFREQIAKGGPVTLTDPEMTRYFMSIHEAAELIVQASSLSRGGDVYLLEMGSPVRILDLAESMIRLAGLRVRNAEHPRGDIELVVTGKRPGEKMYEELFYDDRTAEQTQHPKILRSSNDSTEVDIGGALEVLRAALEERDEFKARQILFEVIQ
ncbi:polysaccharide biosynthesis protein [Devosia riboflavina]